MVCGAFARLFIGGAEGNIGRGTHRDSQVIRQLVLILDYRRCLPEIASCTLQERYVALPCVFRILVSVFVFALPSKPPFAVFICPRHPIDPNLAMYYYTS